MWRSYADKSPHPLCQGQANYTQITSKRRLFNLFQSVFINRYPITSLRRSTLFLSIHRAGNLLLCYLGPLFLVLPGENSSLHSCLQRSLPYLKPCYYASPSLLHLCYSLNNFSPSGPSSEAITATFLKYSLIGPNLFEAQEQKAETVHHLRPNTECCRNSHLTHNNSPAPISQSDSQCPFLKLT